MDKEIEEEIDIENEEEEWEEPILIGTAKIDYGKKVRGKNYVNTRDLHNALIDYVELLKKSSKEDPPRISSYIGECLYFINNKMSTRWNFSQYTTQWKQEMVSDGIEACIKAVNNYDPNQPQKNPFGYFSRIAWRAFLNRIKLEKKENYMKHKSMRNALNVDDISIELGLNNEAGDFSTEASDMVITDFEDGLERAKKKKKAALRAKAKVKKKL